eukprot:GFYU01055772.1.p1 GENE.GFYU01055772.1~~GFYU01055772.1.p1  ORF type:complete len:110 (+),score=4.89 GFYU01055772.1:38-331(+)
MFIVSALFLLSPFPLTALSPPAVVLDPPLVLTPLFSPLGEPPRSLPLVLDASAPACASPVPPSSGAGEGASGLIWLSRLDNIAAHVRHYGRCPRHRT